MSEDEFLVLIVGGGLALFCVGSWQQCLSAPSLVPDRRRLRSLLGSTLLAGSLAVVGVLVTLAASDVRTAPQYIVLYTAVGIAWVCGGGLASTYLGVSARDDVVERRNPAAAIMIAAVILSHAAIYSGANVGNGPGWWVVLISGSIATGCWVAIWLAVNSAAHLHERVTVERDVPAAIRLGALMLAVGLICGRGAAGDWFSLQRTLVEFVVIWPAVVIAALAVISEHMLRGQKAETSIPFALLIGLVWLTVAAYAIAVSPPLAHNPDYPAETLQSSRVTGDMRSIIPDRMLSYAAEARP